MNEFAPLLSDRKGNADDEESPAKTEQGGFLHPNLRAAEQQQQEEEELTATPGGQFYIEEETTGKQTRSVGPPSWLLCATCGACVCAGDTGFNCYRAFNYLAQEEAWAKTRLAWIVPVHVLSLFCFIVGCFSL